MDRMRRLSAEAAQQAAVSSPPEQVPPATTATVVQDPAPAPEATPVRKRRKVSHWLLDLTPANRKARQEVDEENRRIDSENRRIDERNRNKANPDEPHLKRVEYPTHEEHSTLMRVMAWGLLVLSVLWFLIALKNFRPHELNADRFFLVGVFCLIAAGVLFVFALIKVLSGKHGGSIVCSVLAIVAIAIAVGAFGESSAQSAPAKPNPATEKRFGVGNSYCLGLSKKPLSNKDCAVTIQGWYNHLAGTLKPFKDTYHHLPSSQKASYLEDVLMPECKHDRTDQQEQRTYINNLDSAVLKKTDPPLVCTESALAH